MDAFALAAIFMSLVAMIGWCNARFFKLPSAVVMVVAGAGGAVALLASAQLAPGLGARNLLSLIQSVDFPTTTFRYLLAFLLFAGAMQVDFAEVKRRWLAVASLATVGVILSMLAVGVGVWAVAAWLGLALPLAWAFVFGALISPTDPVAVLSAVRQGGFSKKLQAILQGEALFNDGVAIVVFTAAIALALHPNGVSPLDQIVHIVLSAAGGGVLGAVSGVTVIRAIRAIDDYAVQVALSLALAMGVYASAEALALSGPIAVAVAGLLMGDEQNVSAMSAASGRYLRGFWVLVDRILNALLFLLLGLELAIIHIDWRSAGLFAAAIVLVLLARAVIILPWAIFFRFSEKERGTGVVLTWGGLHGAISVALALIVPAGPAKGVILSMTLAVVLFSILVQGLTFGAAAARFAPAPGDDDERPS